MIKTVITALILLVTLTGLSCASHDEKQSVEETKLVITDPTPNSLDLKDQNITNTDQNESSYTFDLQNFNNIPVNFIDSSSKSQDTIADTNRPILFADMHETKTKKSPVTKIIDSDGTQKITSAKNSGAVWQPNGDWFAFITNDGMEAKIAKLNGEEKTLLETYIWDPLYQWPAWSPNGDKVAFIVVRWCGLGSKISSIIIFDMKYENEIVQHGKYDFWDANATEQGPGKFSNPTRIKWSPDGKKILIAWDETVVIDIKTGKSYTITPGRSIAEWSPNSESILYFKNNSSVLNVAKYKDIEGSLINVDLGLVEDMIPTSLTLSPSASLMEMTLSSEEKNHIHTHIFEINDQGIINQNNNGVKFTIAGDLVALNWSPDEKGLSIVRDENSQITLETLELKTGNLSTRTTFSPSFKRIKKMGRILSWSN